ncbi:hypothetical protein SISNIDRAFT_491321 [Sistotremastrum niveocremeum HHB9708]|uniref:Uncharacterized protein n=1 Tax=Sistotremastrum niveocremeum HHB9708 TaxID=1314777 RepID=A0A164MYK5_9AGAM|nr:hypothetical protein SISNIDRAFT_491321 [Sistotremastrum niveocremeum HHB9708]
MDSTHLDRPLKTTLSILQELLLMHEGHSLAPCYAVENFRDVLYEHLVKFLQPWSSAPRMFLSLLWRHDAYICGDASTRYLLGLPAITDSPSSSMLHIICPTSRKQNSMESIGDWLENCEYYRREIRLLPDLIAPGSGASSDECLLYLKQTPFKTMGVKIMPSSNRTLTNGLQFLSMTAHMNMIGENVIHIVYPHMTLAARTIGPVHSRLHLANNFPHLTVLNGTSSHYECAEACHLGDRHALDDRSFQIPIGKQNKVRRLSRNIYYVDGLFCDYQHCPGD